MERLEVQRPTAYTLEELAGQLVISTQLICVEVQTGKNRRFDLCLETNLYDEPVQAHTTNRFSRR